MSKLSHTKEAFKNMMQIGSVTHSSSYLAKKMTEHISSTGSLKILELGAGNGVITRAILKKMGQSSELISYEICDTFIADLNKIDDKRLIVKNENVTELDKLEDGSYDVVVSSLPLALFDKNFKRDIFTNIKNKLKKDGLFVQYQYSLMDRRAIKSHFNNCSVGFCFFNIPPAFVYHARL